MVGVEHRLLSFASTLMWAIVLGCGAVGVVLAYVYEPFGFGNGPVHVMTARAGHPFAPGQPVVVTLAVDNPAGAAQFLSAAVNGEPGYADFKVTGTALRVTDGCVASVSAGATNCGQLLHSGSAPPTIESGSNTGLTTDPLRNLDLSFTLAVPSDACVVVSSIALAYRLGHRRYVATTPEAITACSTLTSGQYRAVAQSYP
jgi:hypothetical protein